jgi:TolA-binding protein
MARRIIIASSGVLGLVCIGLIVFVLSAAALTIDPAQLDSAKQDIFSLIDSGDYAQAEESTDNLLSAFTGGPDMAAAVHQIARRFEQKQQYRQARKYWLAVCDTWPSFSDAMWATMGIASASTFLDDYDTAASATETLFTNYTANPDLPWALYIIAERYIAARRYDEAKNLLERIADAYPENTWGQKAALTSARVGILSLIEEGSYSLAEQELDLVIADFDSHPDLPDTLFAAAERFGWHRRHQEAKAVFERLIQDYPASAAAGQCGLWLARVNACSLIAANKDTEAAAAIDKLIADFDDNPQLADTLYWITKEYEWTKGNVEDRTTRYDTPTNLYQRLTQQFTGTKQTADAEWDYKRITHRTKIFTLMGQDDQNAVDAAIAAMTADFTARPELVSELYWCAREYEEYTAKYSLSKAMYERLATEFPDSIEAGQAGMLLYVRCPLMTKCSPEIPTAVCSVPRGDSAGPMPDGT